MVDGPNRYLKVEMGLAVKAVPVPILVLGQGADDVVGMELRSRAPWRNLP